MADDPDHLPDLPSGPHRVRIHPEVLNDRPFRDLKVLRGVPSVDTLFEKTTLALLACFVSALRQLELWPPTIDGRLVAWGDLEFYFWPCAKSGDVRLLHTRWCKTSTLAWSACRRAARRMHQIRGGYHDEGVDYR